MLMSFGKHKGKQISEIPGNYSNWLANEIKQKILAGDNNPFSVRLCIELMKNVYRREGIEQRVTTALQEYSSQYPTFEENRLYEWLSQNIDRCYRCVIFGVPYVLRQYRSQERYKARQEFIDKVNRSTQEAAAARVGSNTSSGEYPSGDEDWNPPDSERRIEYTPTRQGAVEKHILTSHSQEEVQQPPEETEGKTEKKSLPKSTVKYSFKLNQLVVYKHKLCRVVTRKRDGGLALVKLSGEVRYDWVDPKEVRPSAQQVKT